MRSLIKICNIDDEGWQSDMAQVEKLLDSVKDDHAEATKGVTDDDDAALFAQGTSVDDEQVDDDTPSEYVTGVRLKYRICRLGGVTVML